MKLTKYEHACFTVEKDDQLLVVDPGAFSTDFIAPEGVVAIVVTHIHPDHLDHEQLASIIDKNPEAMIYAHADVISQLEALPSRTIESGGQVEVGPFRLQFSGGTHALIHHTIPLAANLGVMINDLVYYPGDAFTLPTQPVDTLAVPASGPWMKSSEAMDFLTTVRPRQAFPTHDALLSEPGKAIADRLLGGIAEANGINYARLSETIDI